jgi:hypothetical protein
MTELPHIDSFDPEDKDCLASPSKSENSATTGAAHEQAPPTEPAELDIGDPDFMADTYADLRAKGPVSRVRFRGGAEEASGRRWRASRDRSHSARCSDGSRSCGWRFLPRRCAGAAASCAGSRACRSCSRSQSEESRLVSPHGPYSGCSLACGLHEGIVAKIREETLCKASLQLIWRTS